MKRMFMALGLITMLLALSCSRSVEGETSSWKRNKEKISNLQALYPKFQQPLSEQLGKGEKVWNDAQSVGDEDKKIAAMTNANRVLMAGFVGDLDGFSSQKTKVRNLIIDVQQADLDVNDRNAAYAAKDQADATIRECERRLREGARNVSTANSVLRQVKADMLNANKNLKRVLAKAKKKKSDSDKAVAKGKDSKDVKDVKPTSWKCNYCSKMNGHDAKECGGCGAQKGS